MNDNPPSPIRTLLAFALVIAAILGGAFLLSSARPAPIVITVIPPQPTVTPIPSATPGPITVYITGAVAEPGTVTLAHGSRVADALALVGGTTDAADLERVNLADRLHDGAQIHVPEQNEPVELATRVGGPVVYINDADAETLMTLPGIGPTLADAILTYREANGPFADLAALDAVEGIGPALLADLESLISFE
jgi:competence protein ComEA